MTSFPKFLLGLVVILSLTDSVRVSRQDASHLPDFETKRLVGGPADAFSSYSITGAGVRVYVFGTGIDWTKSELKDKASGYLEALPGDTNAVRGEQYKNCTTSSDTSCGLDLDGAGTHAAGLVAGSFLGLAPKAHVFGVKIVSEEADKSHWKQVYRAMRHIHQRHKKENGHQTPAVLLVNLASFDCSSSECQDYMWYILDLLAGKGYIVVSPAGAQNSGDCGFPDALPYVITVGGTTREMHKAAYSNYGSCIDLWAPSDDVMAQHVKKAADRNWYYRSTSVMDNAAALVAGAAALALEISPGLSVYEVKEFLANNKSKKGVLIDLPSGSMNKFLDISFAQ